MSQLAIFCDVSVSGTYVSSKPGVSTKTTGWPSFGWVALIVRILDAADACPWLIASWHLLLAAAMNFADDGNSK